MHYIVIAFRKKHLLFGCSKTNYFFAKFFKKVQDKKHSENGFILGNL